MSKWVGQIVEFSSTYASDEKVAQTRWNRGVGDQKGVFQNHILGKERNTYNGCAV